MAKAVGKRARKSVTLLAWPAGLADSGPLRVLWQSVLLFWRENCVGMAATVAFFGFLSLIPLLLLLLAFVGTVLGGTISPHQVRQLFHSVLPGLSQNDFLHTYWDPVRHSKTATTILGAGSLVVGSLGLHDAVDWAVNRVWHSKKTRPFWLMKLRGVAIILWVVVFAVLSLWLAWLWGVALGRIHSPGFVAASWLALLPSVMIDVIGFSALYKLTPTVHVDLQPALWGGIVASLLWEASKIVFGWWVLEEGSYNRVYGPLAASVIVMLWLWVSAMIFLYGAALSATARVKREAAAPSDPGRRTVG